MKQGKREELYLCRKGGRTMPPKPKFTREEIIKTALDVVSKKGVEGLTARELGEALGSSARPIFTVFKNMEELQDEVRDAAMQRFEDYQAEGITDMPVFKQIGMKMVLFAMEDPKLYQLLFMQEDKEDVNFEEVFGRLGPTADLSIKAVEIDYGLNEEQAKRLFENVWIYTFGVGALCATKACNFSKQMVGQMLTTAFTAMMMLIRAEEKKRNEGETYENTK